MTNTTDTGDVLDFDGFCALARVSPATARRKWPVGELPAPYYVGTRPYWIRSQVLEFLRRRAEQAQRERAHAG
jgi:hypothetical protein